MRTDYEGAVGIAVGVLYILLASASLVLLMRVHTSEYFRLRGGHCYFLGVVGTYFASVYPLSHTNTVSCDTFVFFCLFSLPLYFAPMYYLSVRFIMMCANESKKQEMMKSMATLQDFTDASNHNNRNGSFKSAVSDSFRLKTPFGYSKHFIERKLLLIVVVVVFTPFFILYFSILSSGSGSSSSSSKSSNCSFSSRARIVFYVIASLYFVFLCFVLRMLSLTHSDEVGIRRSIVRWFVLPFLVFLYSIYLVYLGTASSLLAAGYVWIFPVFWWNVDAIILPATALLRTQPHLRQNIAALQALAASPQGNNHSNSNGTLQMTEATTEGFSLREYLSTQNGLTRFALHVRNEFAIESLFFYRVVELYRANPSLKMAETIITTYIASMYEIEHFVRNNNNGRGIVRKISAFVAGSGSGGNEAGNNEGEIGENVFAQAQAQAAATTQQEVMMEVNISSACRRDIIATFLRWRQVGACGVADQQQQAKRKGSTGKRKQSTQYATLESDVEMHNLTSATAATAKTATTAVAAEDTTMLAPPDSLAGLKTLIVIDVNVAATTPSPDTIRHASTGSSSGGGILKAYVDIFNAAQEECYAMLSTDILRRFLVSEAYLADLGDARARQKQYESMPEMQRGSRLNSDLLPVHPASIDNDGIRRHNNNNNNI